MKTCKVIKILNPYSIIIDYGNSKGATVGNLIKE
jgi:hypothetical protein